MATSGELATVSLHARIPPFWRENPRLWFAQFEAVVAPQKIGDDARYNLVVATLQRTDIEQVSDIVLNPPTSGKYDVLKERLLSVYEESEARQIQKLLSGVELGDQKPTQLLRKMRDLAAKKFSDDALRVLWMSHLPPQVRAVVSTGKEPRLEDLAEMADKMMEHVSGQDIASITHTGNAMFETLVHKVEELTVEVAALKRRTGERRQAPGDRRPRFRSRSGNCSDRQEDGWLCYYHHRFGDKARKCVLPCARAAPARPNPEN